MTELPPAHAVALGLGSIPRKFKTSEGPDLSDRSMWTDTPADRLRKEKEKVYVYFILMRVTFKMRLFLMLLFLFVDRKRIDLFRLMSRVRSRRNRKTKIL